jgi:hypothetical protein
VIYCIDLDNTICKTNGTDYKNSEPIPEAVAKVNALYDEGHTIKIFTGRGSNSGNDWRALTVSQLFKWGIKYHTLLLTKPTCDFIIDDKAINAKEWMDGKDRLN